MREAGIIPPKMPSPPTAVQGLPVPLDKHRNRGIYRGKQKCIVAYSSASLRRLIKFLQYEDVLRILKRVLKLHGVITGPHLSSSALKCTLSSYWIVFPHG
jgi:hypothetical protein